MNTRLQVEHPVTEAVTGVDLVRAQLLVASGEPLPWPDGVARRSAATRSKRASTPRIRRSGFLPQAGRLLLYREPRLPGVRIDSGVVEGGDVSVHYDPMLAKVIASAETRDAAIARLAAALRAFPILGIRTNIPFLLRILEHPRFRAGDVDTGFLDREGAALAEETRAMPAFVRAAVASLDEPPGRVCRIRHARGQRLRSLDRLARDGGRDVTRIAAGVYRVEHDGRQRDRLRRRSRRRPLGLLERPRLPR